MDKERVLNEVIEILGMPTNDTLKDTGLEIRTCYSPTLGEGIELDYHRMYDAPELSFATLKKISEYFGTKNIDVDNYSQSGCETCDYGSRYGHRIEIYGATKNF